MKRMFTWIGCLAILLVAMPGCITTSKGTQNQAEIAELKAKIQLLENQNSELEQRLSGIGEKSAEAYLAFEQMQQEISIMRGRYEESSYNAKKYQDETKGLRDFMGSQLSTVDKRLGVLEKKAGIKDAQTLDKLPASGQAAGLIVGKNDKQTPEDLYREAYNAFKATNLEMAKAKFRLFLNKYPKDKMADSAQFNLAECFYKQKDWENAILEYDKVTAKYPGSKLTRSAYLNLGFAFLELGSKADARLFFQKVMDDYPGTQEAKIAKKKLEISK